MDIDTYGKKADKLTTAAAIHQHSLTAGHNLEIGPATRKVFVYSAGSTVLMNMLTLVGIPGFKIGVTGCSTAWARITDLRHKHYGGIWKRPGDDADAGRTLRGAKEWSLVYMDEKHMKGGLLPAGITLERGWIVLHVPPHITVEDVNRAVHDLLQPRCLRQKFAGPEMQAALARFGYDPRGWFHTAYDRMSGAERISAAEELYEFQPRVELPWFIARLAEMMAGFPNEQPSRNN